MIRTGLLSTGIFMLMVSAAWSQKDPTAQTSALMATGRPGSTEPAPAAASPGADKLLDLPPLKKGAASLIGGSLESIDRVRDRMVIRPFGHGTMRIAFDPRTEFLRGSAVARAQDMRPGDRVYVETVLNGTAVFAKVVHLPETAAQGSVRGQVIDYDAARGELSVSDLLSTEAVRIRVTSTTTISGGSLGQGALVQLSFLPGQGRPVARQIRVLIAPGTVATFSGRITAFDLTAQELVLVNANDGNRYQIQFNPAVVDADSLARLQEGANVTISARFNGQSYVAEKVSVGSRADR